MDLKKGSIRINTPIVDRPGEGYMSRLLPCPNLAQWFTPDFGGQGPGFETQWWGFITLVGHVVR